MVNFTVVREMFILSTSVSHLFFTEAIQTAISSTLISTLPSQKVEEDKEER